MGTHGKVASPLWPGNYPHNSDYQWIVNVNASQVVHGRILEMDIESTHNCYYDKLRVSFQVKMMLINRLFAIGKKPNKSKLVFIQLLQIVWNGLSPLNHDYPLYITCTKGNSGIIFTCIFIIIVKIPLELCLSIYVFLNYSILYPISCLFLC